MAKAAATLLTNEKARKGVGWVLVAILSPIIVLVALLCSLGSGAADHNISAAQLCFQTGPIPADIPAEYRICIEQTRANFTELDTVIADIQSNMDEGNSLDPIRVKAVFFPVLRCRGPARQPVRPLLCRQRDPHRNSHREG